MGKKIHMIGIGGIGMSALALCLMSRGYEVTGSDLKGNEQTERLIKAGLIFYKGHNEKNVDNSVATVVRSAAIKDDNVEVEKAKELGINIKKYSQMLGEVMKESKGIAVSGCHGKTTTTSLVSYIMSRSGMDPTFVCGGDIPQLGGNARAGKGEYFIAEACEYDRSFLNLRPKTVIITNIEPDHLDYYKDIDEIIDTYKELAALTGKEGVLIGNIDDFHTAGILKEFNGKGVSYSIKNSADWQAKNIVFQNDIHEFDVYLYGEFYGKFSLKIPGLYNVSNALSAIAAASMAGVQKDDIKTALEEFNGAARRFQLIGEKKGVVVVDDYGHHPTEVRAVLRAAREKYPDRKLWVIFQPHQHSRTRMMLKEFSEAFDDAHRVLLPDIFYARDNKWETENITSKDLADKINKNGKKAHYLPSFEEVVEYLNKNAGSNIIALTLGAGNVNEIGNIFLQSK